MHNLIGFQQLIESETREITLSSTLKDHAVTTNKSNIVISGIQNIGLRNNYLTYAIGSSTSYALHAPLGEGDESLVQNNKLQSVLGLLATIVLKEQFLAL